MARPERERVRGSCVCTMEAGQGLAFGATLAGASGHERKIYWLGFPVESARAAWHSGREIIADSKSVMSVVTGN